MDSHEWRGHEISKIDLSPFPQFILGVRKIRSGYDIKPSQPLPVLLEDASQQDRERLTTNAHYIQFLAHTASIDVLDPGTTPPESATALDRGEARQQGGVDKAPAEVVEKERAKVEDVKAALGSLKEQRRKIEGL